MRNLVDTVFDPNMPHVVRASRIGMATVLSLILVIHGMILAI